MNRRIRKKKEKQSIMEYSYEIVPDISYKLRKKSVDKQWKMYHNSEDKIMTGYKRK